jgi:hypothetical protein
MTEKPNPFYPNLSEEGLKQFELLIERFKTTLAAAADDAIGRAYLGLADYIESDSWIAIQNSILDGLKGYPTNYAKYDFQTIRAKMLEEHREAIIKDLNQDHLDEIERLKKTIKDLQTLLSYR